MMWGDLTGLCARNSILGSQSSTISSPYAMVLFYRLLNFTATFIIGKLEQIVDSLWIKTKNL